MNIKTMDNDLLSIQEARILAENAAEAQKVLAGFTQEKIDEIVARMAEAAAVHAEELAVLSADETGYGNSTDKAIKNRFVTEYLPKKLEGMKCVGLIDADPEKGVMEIGVPVGVIVSVCPATNPVSTAIYTSLIGIKAGNAVIISPHPTAEESVSRVMDVMIKAAEGYGLPEGALSYLHIAKSAGTRELINHSCTSMIIDTGVPRLLKDSYHSGKPVIYGGRGNGPAFVEKTADAALAAESIVASKSFDYGVVSASEQSVVVDRDIAPAMREAMKAAGAYFMTDEEAEKLGSVLYFPDGGANKVLIGRPAAELALTAGFKVPAGTRVLVSERKYVAANNPYERELLCPVLAFYVEEDWINACEKCIELLLADKKSHTLVIHSKDPGVISHFAMKKPVSRVLVNTSSVFGSMGATTNLFPAMTLGSGAAGEGITSDNVSPMNLIYKRKVGYGVRTLESLGLGSPKK